MIITPILQPRELTLRLNCLLKVIQVPSAEWEHHKGCLTMHHSIAFSAVWQGRWNLDKIKSCYMKKQHTH